MVSADYHTGAVVFHVWLGPQVFKMHMLFVMNPIFFLVFFSYFLLAYREANCANSDKLQNFAPRLHVTFFCFNKDKFTLMFLQNGPSIDSCPVVQKYTLVRLSPWLFLVSKGGHPAG